MSLFTDATCTKAYGEICRRGFQLHAARRSQRYGGRGGFGRGHTARRNVRMNSGRVLGFGSRSTRAALRVPQRSESADQPASRASEQRRDRRRSGRSCTTESRKGEQDAGRGRAAIALCAHSSGWGWVARPEAAPSAPASTEQPGPSTYAQQQIARVRAQRRCTPRPGVPIAVHFPLLHRVKRLCKAPPHNQT